MTVAYEKWWPGSAADDHGSTPQLIAIDDGAVYWKPPGGEIDAPLLRYDVSTGEQTEVEVPAGASPVDVAAGAISCT